MKKEVDYLQAICNFDKSMGRKSEDFDAPLRDSVDADGGVDYLKVSREYGCYLEMDQSEVICDAKQ